MVILNANSSKIEALYMYNINIHSDDFFYLFLSTLNSALASFFLLALVFMDIQNSTANSSTNFLFIKVGNLRKINTDMKFSHKIDKNSILISFTS